ncbi:hypothetical protein NsoK4_09115 [Nitrosopumilus sp. K4]|uniref:hypothetical protein n=1 Tax=Nitrosopumilus sp. K4 TaxID=2795383 RepID=UPI001BA6B00D|nr:hypothetical protein [Nitrosopumilus sp. K4]QUC64566.1 hypothetical protein NsoK4_09115 [Nitrosopumilus sp. K4]
MTELERKVFGKITTKEIIGAEPPAIPDTKNMLESELQTLLSQLESQSKEDLKKLLAVQQESEKLVNSRPGAMALAQDKIQMYTEYSQKYIQSINQKLES